MTHRARTAGLFLFLLNTAYLAAYASPTGFYFTNVALHIALGAALAVWYGRDLRDAWRRTPLWARLSSLVLAAGAAFGLVIVVIGAYGPYRWLLPVHIALSLAGGLPLLIGAATVQLRQADPQRRLAAAIAILVVAAAGTASAIAIGARPAKREAAYRIVNPKIPPMVMDEEGAGPASPFFPSAADTNVHRTIPSTFFMTSESCGRCHQDIYEQWKSSMHHFSSFNNQWYRKSIEYMQDTIGTQPSKWCAGCHDHAVFFNGRFEKPIKEQIETAEAQAGLACTSCHAITKVRSTMGQGDFEIEYPPLHDLAASENPILRFAHDRMTLIDPQPHKEIFLKPFHTKQTPDFCSSCHKVHLDVPVNSYRWFRGFNDYDNWQASGISGEGARSFYYPKASQKCADCHMPQIRSNDPAAKNGFVRSHRFAAANTAVPYVNGDKVQLKAVQDFLKDGQISVDVFGIVREPAPAASAQKTMKATAEPAAASTFAVGEESMNFGAAANILAPPADVIAPLDKAGASVRRGDSVRVEVVVRTRKVGHFFPGGTVDAFDVWVELEAVDESGRTIFHSGAVADDGKGPVDPAAHFYRSLLLDERGNVINKRNAWAARSVAYVRLIPPGAADTIHYRLDIPENAGSKITLRAKVNYRKFAWWNTQFAYAGVRDPAVKNPAVAPSYDDGKWVFSGDTSKVSGGIKAIPDIPTTVMANASAELTVLPRGAALPASAPVMNPAVRERWNDYGIGLLLQGDITNAESTFLKVTKMDPKYADGWVNAARARIQQGNVEDAETLLRDALKIDPNLAKTHFFLGTALKALGRYDEAVDHLQRAAAQYPRDRVVQNQLGRVLFLQRKFPEALDAFQKVLGIDPEDLQAHYNMMLSYQGLGDATAAARERQLYLRFKADESAQAITGPYRRLHPEDNNERQQIHEHAGPARSRVEGPAPSRVEGRSQR